MQKESQSDFHFVERPSQDFFCPVSFELLLEPQLTSCCGHHLSLEVATRLRKECKPCPLCNGEQWQCMLDKNCRRKVHQMRVLCWYNGNGCGWVGGICELEKHADSCEKRPWTCKYCQVEFPYVEGGEKHWSTCPKFPEPCPNSCEVGSVERCNLEQHRSECSLEPVACEMKEFGCSVVVPRKELARHMRESELQHLTAGTMLNLRLTRQLQWEALEREKKIVELQREIKKLQTEMQAEMRVILEKLKGIQEENEQQKQQFQEDGASSGCAEFTLSQYSKMRDSGGSTIFAPFYTHPHGYKLRLKMGSYNDGYINVRIYMVKGEYDDELLWPANIKGYLELLNQAGDYCHVKDFGYCWYEGHRNECIEESIKLSKLEEEDPEVRMEDYVDTIPPPPPAEYLKNDCLKFRIKTIIL